LVNIDKQIIITITIESVFNSHTTVTHQEAGGGNQLLGIVIPKLEKSGLARAVLK